MAEQAMAAAVLALVGLAYLSPGRIDALGRFRDSQRVLIVAGAILVVISNGLLMWSTRSDDAGFRAPSWAVSLAAVTTLLVVATALSARRVVAAPQRMNAPVSPGARELIGVPATCAAYALVCLAEVTAVGRRNRDAFAYDPPLPPAVTERYSGAPLPRHETYVADSWVIGIAVAVTIVAVVAVAAARRLARGDDPDRPGLAQHIARSGAAAALIAGTGTALFAADQILRINEENHERYRAAGAMMRDAGVTDMSALNAVRWPGDLQGASSGLETIGNLPNLIGWTLFFLVIGRVFVTNGIRGSSGEVSSPVQ